MPTIVYDTSIVHWEHDFETHGIDIDFKVKTYDSCFVICLLNPYINYVLCVRTFFTNSILIIFRPYGIIVLMSFHPINCQTFSADMLIYWQTVLTVLYLRQLYTYLTYFSYALHKSCLFRCNVSYQSYVRYETEFQRP